MSRPRLEAIDAAVVVVCAAVFFVAGLPVHGCLTDDTYIHLQYARNLAETGDLAFNRGEPSYGATSPLWVGLLALLRLAGADPERWIAALSIIAGASTVALTYLLVMRVEGRRPAAAAAALIIAFEAWMLRWSGTGMETSLAVLTVAWVLYLALHREMGAGRSLLLGAAMFLAFLARPEALLLAPLALVSFAVAGRRTPAAGRFGWLAVLVPLVAAWLLLMKAHTGTALPLTAGAKQGRPEIGLQILRQSFVVLRIIGVTLLLPALAGGLLVVRRVSGRDRAEPGHASPAGLLLCALWAVSLPAVYVLLDFHVISRYLLPVAPVIAAAGAISVSRLARKRRPALRTAVLAAFTAAVAAQNLAVFHSVIVRPTREFSEDLQEVLVGMGRWLASNSGPDAVVAASDIGAVGYVSRRRILDLGGLVHRGINEMRRETDWETIVEEGLYLEYGPDYMIDRHEEPARLAGRTIRGARFVPVMSGEVSNLGIRKPEPVTYVLYRLERAKGGGVVE